MNNNIKILEEQLFPHEGMSYDEMKFYLNNIIKNCKDICDTNNKVNNKSICNIVEMKFKKKDNVVLFNGSVLLDVESRFIDGCIYIEKNSISVDMHVTRLCVECNNKEYKVFDEFIFDNNLLKRKSFYNYDMKNSYCIIQDEKVKGKLL